MAQENREIIAAVLAAGIIANSSKPVVQAIAPTDAAMAVVLYHHCLEALDRHAELGAN